MTTALKHQTDLFGPEKRSKGQPKLTVTDRANADRANADRNGKRPSSPW